jgi:hypothetical protein
VPNQDRLTRPLTGQRLPAAARLVRGVYLATPLFVLADLAFGFNVRTPFFDATPALKWVYYLAACGAGIVVWKWPRLTAHIGFVESGLNIALTVLSVGLAYTRLAAGSEDPAVPSPFTADSIAALPLSAMILILSYVASHAEMSRARRRDG